VFVGEVSANKAGEGVITIGARGEIFRRAELGQPTVTSRETKVKCVPVVSMQRIGHSLM
jgi:hypothetical protein